jgi:hypothetical protein
MSLKRLLNLIDNTGIGNFVSSKQSLIENTNPDRIYIENVRSFFNLPSTIAKLLCDIAVRQNVFRKQIGVLCPNKDCGRIIKTYDSIEEIEEVIECEQCLLKEEDKHSFSKEQIKIIVFYQLIQNEYVY